jgi:hypothetical protein
MPPLAHPIDHQAQGLIFRQYHTYYEAFTPPPVAHSRSPADALSQGPQQFQKKERRNPITPTNSQIDAICYTVLVK